MRASSECLPQMTIFWLITQAALHLSAFWFPTTNRRREGSGIHSPAICIPGGGWEVSKWETVATSLRTLSGKSLSVNRAVIQKGMERAACLLLV